MTSNGDDHVEATGEPVAQVDESMLVVSFSYAETRSRPGYHNERLEVTVSLPFVSTPSFVRDSIESTRQMVGGTLDRWQAEREAEANRRRIEAAEQYEREREERAPMRISFRDRNEADPNIEDLPF